MIRNDAGADELETGESTTMRSSPPKTKQHFPAMEALDSECYICLQEFVEGDEMSISHNLECTHFFHKQCIVDWLVCDERCPTCRNNYLKENDDNKMIGMGMEETDEDGPIEVASGADGSNSYIRDAVIYDDVEALGVRSRESAEIARTTFMLQNESRGVHFPVGIPAI